MKWLAVVAVLVGVAVSALSRPVSAQTYRGYDWCYEFTFDFNDEGFVYGSNVNHFAGFLSQADGSQPFSTSYTAPGPVNAKLIEVSFLYGGPLVGTWDFAGTINGFGSFYSFDQSFPTSTTANSLVLYPGGNGTNTFSIDWTSSTNSSRSLDRIRVYGDGASPWGGTRCNDLPTIGFCWQLDFNQLAIANGYLSESGHIRADQNNLISFSYNSPVTVYPMEVYIAGDTAMVVPVSFETVGNVFGIDTSVTGGTGSQGKWWAQFSAASPLTSGNTINVTLLASAQIYIEQIRITGQLPSPVQSNCYDSGGVIPVPTHTSTPLPTSLPTETPGPTETPTATATATDTPPPSPTWSPTPTPTPTDMVFFGPVLEAEGSSAAAWVRMFIRDTRDAFSRPIGVIWLTGANGRSLEHEEQYATPALTYGVHGDLGTGPQVNNMAAAPTTAWNAISTAFPGVSLVAMPATAVIPVGSQFGAGLRFGCCVGDGTPGPTGITGRFVYMGQPTPTPTPTLTPSATRTPTVTRTPTITRTPGPTFTPNPNATATRTPTRTPFQVNPPGTPLPTAYGWMTPTGTVIFFGTPWSTPQPPGTATPVNTPGDGTGTPVVTHTPTPTGSPTATLVFGDGSFTGDMGQINQLGGDVFGTANNLFGLGSGWLGILSGRISGIIGAWNTAPVTAPPGVPLCQTNPTSNELCAIFYIIRYTILSGPAGVVIMPLATVVLDLFIVFMFIRMLRAILARIARLVET